jgi:hypothetical protein
VRHLLKSPWAGIATAQVAVMLALQALNLAVAVPRPNGADPAGYYAWAQSWLEDGDSDPANQLTPGRVSPVIRRVFPVIEINGRPTLINRYPIGWSAAVFPFMALGHEIVGTRRVDGKPGDDGAHNGLEPLVVRMAWIGVYLWTLLGVLATYDSIRRLMGLRAAVLGTVAAWLGTSAFAYTWKSPGMVHSITLAVISLSFWSAVRARGSRHAWAWSLLWGIFASLTVCARVIDGIVLLPSFFLLLQSQWASDEQQTTRALRIRAIVTSSLWALLGFLPLSLFQMSIWHTLYGQWYFDGYAATGYGFSPNLRTLGLSLFSPDKGSLLWHPLIILAVGGLVLASISTPRNTSIRPLAPLLVAIVIVMFALYGSWGYWSLGDGYGARWTADLFWIWAFGLALLFARSKRIMRPVIVTVAVFSLASVGWIGGQIVGKIPLH